MKQMTTEEERVPDSRELKELVPDGTNVLGAAGERLVLEVDGTTRAATAGEILTARRIPFSADEIDLRDRLDTVISAATDASVRQLAQVLKRLMVVQRQEDL
jgi:hypothetical protein